MYPISLLRRSHLYQVPLSPCGLVSLCGLSTGNIGVNLKKKNLVCPGPASRSPVSPAWVPVLNRKHPNYFLCDNFLPLVKSNFSTPYFEKTGRDTRRLSQSPVMDTNTSTSAFSSMLASSYGTFNFPPQLDMVLEAVTTASPWTIFLTLLAMCVVYDQGMLFPILNTRATRL